MEIEQFQENNTIYINDPLRRQYLFLALVHSRAWLYYQKNVAVVTLTAPLTRLASRQKSPFYRIGFIRRRRRREKSSRFSDFRKSSSAKVRAATSNARARRYIH